MSDETFAIGDTVKLRSGGPLMTVTGTNLDHVHVIWVRVDGAAATATLPIPCLLKTEPGKK